MWMFQSPSQGMMTLSELSEDMKRTVRQYPEDDFRLIIGSDSQPKPQLKTVTFVTAVILHHVGKGARYYIHREQVPHMYSLRQRMFTEASYSLQVGGMLSEEFPTADDRLHVEVHLDIGERGATHQLIREIVAWITSSGYEAHIKPDAYGASKVADRYTKS
ncbi:MAG: ribonuclease H-like YkuK family protein [Alicyclobacillaceae bacterium]|jgi:predicted RNase H-related nuclease YkuK (DUF458 family)|uniref:ribonuclease H-like YkuK family protein n=1 Tax=Alicyclobacillus sp. SP_1 TaxID=2942475 RepID=UPI002157B27D|nr:ribonuclease H-like YkuK family protein [Alicyclobacillus sp. SP_1]MCY0887829.1 ribonuclease H-like YkuK family protein [Alicyclobacillaceae bacterium]